ncbi:MAG: hypothetical protein Kow0077_09410 [Anaerolineae bacterium]
MDDKVYHGGVDRLRAPERVARLEVDRVVTLTLEGIRAASVLDIGTGTGLFAEAFAARGLQVTGIDLNPEMIARARELVPAATFQLGRLEAIPFPDRAFDVAFLGHVLHETHTPVAALREVRRVTRQRVAILEWPYREEEHGPALDHRLPADHIARYASEAGYTQTTTLTLAHMVLVLLAC